MSVVYLAEDTLLQHRRVAIKELRPDLDTTASDATRAEAEAWFARESYLLSALRHPLIPAFYSVFREGGCSYIVQEYVPGETLEHLVARGGPLDEVQVVRWAIALCGLLTYLHDRDEPILYRDLKPANIILRTPSVRDLAGAPLAVVDFGIARPFAGDLAGTVIGTPGYAPPEQYQGLATPQSDIYALGATLHRLLTGYDPEQGTPFTFPAIRTLNPAVSPELEALVMRAVALDPRTRYESAAAFGAALATQARRGGAARTASIGPTPRPSYGRTMQGRSGRHRLIGAAMCVMLLAPAVLSQLRLGNDPAPGTMILGNGTPANGMFIGPAQQANPGAATCAATLNTATNCP